MTVNQKVSKMHAGKSLTLCEGVNGKGQTIWIIYTESKAGAVHGETFTSQKEAQAWWKHSCN